MHDGFEADGELVVAGGRRPVAFEPANAALHGVACLVVLDVEDWCLPPAAPRFLRVAGLVGGLGEGGFDPVVAQIFTVGPRRVRLAAAHSIRPLP